MRAQRLRNFIQISGFVAIRFEHVFLRKNIQRGERGTTRQRIAGVRMRMQKAARGFVCVKRLVDFVARHHDGKRQIAAGNAFGNT